MKLKPIIRVKHSKNEFNHINDIKNFWGYAKHRLSKFKSIKKENFLLHIKECEFRYILKLQKKDFKIKPNKFLVCF